MVEIITFPTTCTQLLFTNSRSWKFRYEIIYRVQSPTCYSIHPPLRFRRNVISPVNSSAHRPRIERLDWTIAWNETERYFYFSILLSFPPFRPPTTLFFSRNVAGNGRLSGYDVHKFEFMARREFGAAIKRDRNPISPRQFPPKNSPTNESLFPRDLARGEGGERDLRNEHAERKSKYFPNSASVSITFDVYLCALHIAPRFGSFRGFGGREGEEVLEASRLFSTSRAFRSVIIKAVG